MAIYSNSLFYRLKLILSIMLLSGLASTLSAQNISNVDVEILPTEIDTCYGCGYTIDSIVVRELGNVAFGRTGVGDGDGLDLITISAPSGFIFTSVGDDVSLGLENTDIGTSALTPALSDDSKTISFHFQTEGLTGDYKDSVIFSDIEISPIEGFVGYGSTISVGVYLDGAGNDSTYEFTGYSMDQPSFDFISYTTSDSCGYAQTDITFEIIDTASSVIKPTLSGSYFYYGAAGC